MLKVHTVHPGRGSDQLPEDPCLLAEWLSPHWPVSASEQHKACPVSTGLQPGPTVQVTGGPAPYLQGTWPEAGLTGRLCSHRAREEGAIHRLLGMFQTQS